MERAPTDRAQPERAAEPERVTPSADRERGEPAQAAPADPRAQLDAIVRPEAKAADAAPLPDLPEPQARRVAGVTMLEPGAEPRAIARLEPAPASAQRVSLHLGMDVAMQLGKQAVPAQTVPALDVDLELKVIEPTSEGAARYHLRVTDVRVQADDGGSARVREAVTKAAEELAKIEGDATLGTDGFAADGLDIELADDNGLAPTFAGFRDAYAHLFVQLPSAPIGEGARWEVVTHGDVSGLPVQRVATYTLTHREGDRLTLDVAVAEHTTTAADGERPPEPEGPVRPLSYTATGKGAVALDLSRLAPREAAITSQSATRVQAAFGGDPTDVLMGLSVKAELSATPG